MNILQTNDDWTLLLPDEILLKIFKHLPKTCLLNMSSVCQRWNRISSDIILWKGIDISETKILFSDLARILRKGVVALKMVGAEVRRTRTSLESSEGLTMLDANGAKFYPSNLFEIISKCRKLEKLSLECCILNDDISREIGARSRLMVLNIRYCKVVTAEFISQLSRLEELNISCIELTNNKNISYLPSHFPITLKRLSIRKVSQWLIDEDIRFICLSCPDLIQLDICENEGLTDLTIDIIMEFLPNLQHLSVSGCFSITLHKLKELKYMKSLQMLSIHHMMDEAEIEILSKLLVGVQVKKYYYSTMAHSYSGGEDKLWGFPIDKF